MSPQISLLMLLSISLLGIEGVEHGCNQDTHFYDEEQKSCCKKCEPGFRLSIECAGDSETVCEACSEGYWSGRNYHPNCFRCSKCSVDRGFRYAQNCSATQDAKCVCQSGMFCSKGFSAPYCRKECTKYKTCPPGEEVIISGTANSDVVCGTPDQSPKLPAATQKPTLQNPIGNPRPAFTQIPSTSSAPARTTATPLTTAPQSTGSVLTSISHATTSTGTLVFIIAGCLAGLLIMVGIFIILLRRQNTGSSEKKAPIENGCAEAVIHPSPTEAQLLLNQNGMSDTSSGQQTTPAPLNGLSCDPSITSLEQQTSLSPLTCTIVC